MSAAEFNGWETFLSIRPPVSEILLDFAAASGISMPVYFEHAMSEEELSNYRQMQFLKQVKQLRDHNNE